MDKPQSLPNGISLDCVIEGNAFDPDRERVRELRMDGVECSEISEQTGLSADQVEAYCTQLGLPVSGSCRLVGPTPEEDWMKSGQSVGRSPFLCPQCGAVIIQSRRGRKRKFCSDDCKNAWWNRRWKDQKEKHGRKAVCKNCGSEFIAFNEYGTERRYCCRECYFEHRYGVMKE